MVYLKFSREGERETSNVVIVYCFLNVVKLAKYEVSYAAEGGRLSKI